MIAVISPAKTLDYETPPVTPTYSQPAFLEDSRILVEQLKTMSPEDLSSLMKISDQLGVLNANRYQTWQTPFTPENAKQAVLAFKGDVYVGLEAETFSEEDFQFAQEHLRILSGLYGLLRPLDLMQPYRLEMGTRLSNPLGRDLYAFWGDSITQLLQQDMAEAGVDVLVNLASQEYFRALRPAALNARVITPVFEDEKNGKYKIISFYAKKARGLMAAWIIQNKIEHVQQLEQFDQAGYRFVAADSHADTLLFRRAEGAS